MEQSDFSHGEPFHTSPPWEACLCLGHKQHVAESNTMPVCQKESCQLLAFFNLKI